MNNKIIIFSGPSGSGKSTIINYILKQDFPMQFAVSATSRAPRGKEKDGVEYYFITPEAFKQKIRNDEFLEYEEVYKDSFYGSLRSEVERIFSAGCHVIFDVDVAGGRRLKNIFGERSMTVFIKPPSIEVLRKRLYGRQTDTPEVIESRLAKAAYELEFVSQYDAVVISDQLEQVLADTLQLVTAFLDRP
ncbi:MAG: guanylate kinase [Tannerella sp.]|jgi:guanylate kinase|nr:guanylate kinase [Tannerella sp.]